jgi:ribonuclease R
MTELHRFIWWIRTIPMLPEKLSNGVCSLRPHEEKLTFSVVVKMNEKAEVLDTWIGKTVIYSDRRFSYEEAQARIESKDGDLADEINILNKLALILREQRFKKGAISSKRKK